MNKRVFSIVFSVGCLAAVLSCSDEYPGEDYSLSLDGNQVVIVEPEEDFIKDLKVDLDTIPSRGGQQKVTFSSNTNWTVLNEAEWLHASRNMGANNGEIVFSAEDYPSIHPRKTTTYIITLTGQRIHFTTVQAARYLRLSEEELTFTGASSEQVVTVDTDSPGYRLSDNYGWIHHEAKDGKITIRVDANTGEEERLGQVVVSMDGLLEGESYSRTITVKQQGRTADPEPDQHGAVGGSGYGDDSDLNPKDPDQHGTVGGSGYGEDSDLNPKDPDQHGTVGGEGYGEDSDLNPKEPADDSTVDGDDYDEDEDWTPGK